MNAQYHEIDHYNYLEQPFIPSPMILSVIRDFRVAQHFKADKVVHSNRLLDTAVWETHLRGVTDSMDPFDDDMDMDEIIHLTEDNATAAPPHSSPPNDQETERRLWGAIDIYVQPSTLGMGDVYNECQLRSEVRSAALVRGDGPTDILALSFYSGILALVEVVPGELGDKFELVVSDMLTINSSDPKTTKPKFSDQGRDVLVHPHGKVIVTTSYSGSIRFYDLQGAKFRKTCNVTVEGIVIECCFLHSPALSPKSHTMFIVVYQLPGAMLNIQLIEMYSGGDFDKPHHVYAPLIVPNKTEIPLFLVPLKNTNGFLYVTPTEIIFIGTSYMISQSGNDFITLSVDSMEIPVCFYIPETFGTHTESSLQDTVFIGDCKGRVFAVEIVWEKDKSVWSATSSRLTALPRSFEGFSLEKSHDGEDTFEFKAYAADYVVSMTGELDPKLFRAQRTNTEHNWSSVVDTITVPPLKAKNAAVPASEELWVVSAGGAPALWNLRRGYKATKNKQFCAPVQKVDKVFTVKTGCYCYTTTKRSWISGVSLSGEATAERLELDSPTVFCGRMTGTTGIWATPSTITLFNINTFEILETFETSFRILNFHAKDKFAILAYESGGSTTVEVFILQEDLTLSPILTEANLDYVSFVHVGANQTHVDDRHDFKALALFGGYDNKIHVRNLLEDEQRDINLLKDTRPATCSGISDVSVCYGGDRFIDLYIGYRNGTVLYVHDVFKASFPLNRECYDRNTSKIGDKAVYFVQASEGILFAISRNIWLLNSTKEAGGKPEPVVVQERFDKSTYHAVMVVAQEDWTFEEDWRLQAVRSDGRVDWLDVEKHVSTIPKRVKLYDVPSKMMYMDVWNLFVILTPGSSSEMCFVDHVTLSVIGARFSGEEKDSKPLFEDYEEPTCMTKWTQPAWDKSGKVTGHRVHLVIGCRNKLTNTGVVKVVDLRRMRGLKEGERDFVLVTYLTSWKCPEGPVLAIAEVSSSSEIVYSCGKNLFFFRYNPTTKKMVRFRDKLTLTSNVIGINEYTNGDVLFTLNDNSVVKANWSGEVDNFVMDSISRRPMSKALMVGEDTVVVSDRLHGTISFLKSQRGSLNEWHKVYMPFIPRLLLGQLKPLWHHYIADLSYLNETSILELWGSAKLYPPQQDPTLEGRFLACGINGAVTLFTRLSDEDANTLQQEIVLRPTRNHVQNTDFFDSAIVWQPAII